MKKFLALLACIATVVTFTGCHHHHHHHHGPEGPSLYAPGKPNPGPYHHVPGLKPPKHHGKPGPR